MLTASIVIHRTPAHQIDKVLECLLRSEVDRIFVIDNSPVECDNPRLPDDMRIIYRRVENRGFGAGHNIAIKEILATSKYHLVLNADVWWEGDILSKLSAYMDEHLEVGMVAPKVYYPDGDLQYTCRMLPTPYDLFAKRFLPARLTRRRMERYLLAEHDHNEQINCPYLLGSFLFFRVDRLKECGIFDERFFMYPEDIDITRRIHEVCQTIYNPDVSIVHEHAAASRKDRRMLRIHLVNMIKYFNKWGWFYDPRRRYYNRHLRHSIIPVSPSAPPSARG